MNINIFNRVKRLHNDYKRRIEEIAFFANQAKNSAAVYLGNHTALTCLYTGQKVYVDTRDMSLAPHLLMQGEWEMDVTRIWQQLVQLLRPRCIFDVGANAGYFGILAAGWSHDARVHLFEANPRLCALISKSLIINGLSGRCKASPMAVSDQSDKSVTLFIPGDYFGSASVETSVEAACEARDDITSIDRVTVKTKTIDDICSENGLQPELIKIDVESHEEHVLRGAGLLLSKRQTMVLMEYTPNAYSADFATFLQKNFTDIYVLEGGILKTCKSVEELSTSNDFSMVLLSNTPVRFG